MAVTLHRLVPKVRIEKAISNFTSATGNVGIWELETENKSIGIRFMLLISDTAVTPAHFYNFDDGEDVPIGTLLIDQTTGTPCMWMNTAADTYVEIGEVT